MLYRPSSVPTPITPPPTVHNNDPPISPTIHENDFIPESPPPVARPVPSKEKKVRDRKRKRRDSAGGTSGRPFWSQIIPALKDCLQTVQPMEFHRVDVKTKVYLRETLKANCVSFILCIGT
jgi:hypothetical protein